MATGTPSIELQDDGRLLCLPPGEPGSPTAVAYAVAMDLAAETNSAIVLYERGDESWRAEHEHDNQAIDPSDERLADMEGLDAAVAAAEAAGVELSVWRSTVPSVGTGVLDAIQYAEVTAIVLPEKGGGASMSDHLLGRGTKLVDTVEEMLAKPVVADAGAADVPLLVVDEDGTVTHRVTR